jgi:hypothetical protein
LAFCIKKALIASIQKFFECKKKWRQPLAFSNIAPHKAPPSEARYSFLYSMLAFKSFLKAKINGDRHWVLPALRLFKAHPQRRKGWSCLLSKVD